MGNYNWHSDDGTLAPHFGLKVEVKMVSGTFQVQLDLAGTPRDHNHTVILCRVPHDKDRWAGFYEKKC